MEDIENSGQIAIGSGIIVNAEDGRYIGFLQGTDDTYLYLKATHRWGEKDPEVSEESSVNLRELLAKRPLWLLKAQVGVLYRMLPIGMGQEQAVEMLAEAHERNAVAKYGTFEAFLPEPKAVHMALPHMNILNFESLQDVMSGNILEELDFPANEDENDDRTNDE